MRVAARGGMNLVQFQVKRAHWRLWDFEAKLLRIFGTTPARLDMLQCIAQNGAPTQSILVWQLGLHPSTVSKMLELLRQRGWIVRDVDPRDRRRRVARLTDLARDLLDRIERVLLRSGIARKAQARCLVDIPDLPKKVFSLFERTRRVQWALEDRAPFRPDSERHHGCDLGESLEPHERSLYRRAIAYCQERFGHLPVAYVLET